MKMRNFSVSVSAFVVASLCVASVAMADLARVNIVMDISGPYNVTLTSYEDTGTYGGQWFAMDALEIKGAVAELNLTGPRPFGFNPPMLDLPIVTADGDTICMFTSGTAWMEYGESYNLGALVESSDPDDFYCVDGDDIYPRSFMVYDTVQQNGLGGPKFLGTIIPEPASMGLLAVGAWAIIRRRRN